MQQVCNQGINDIPCWVEDMSDEGAYMELVTANSQGELLPIEIGHHFNQIGNKAQGKKGYGMKAYADSIGRPVKFIEINSKSDEVYSSLTNMCSEVKDKPRHLYEISKASQDTWQVLVDNLTDCEWTVKETKAAKVYMSLNNMCCEVQSKTRHLSATWQTKVYSILSCMCTIENIKDKPRHMYKTIKQCLII